jgi:hypothetical protein
MAKDFDCQTVDVDMFWLLLWLAPLNVEYFGFVRMELKSYMLCFHTDVREHVCQLG